MFKKIWFQVHWFIGITAGTVLMFIGVTGAILSFREEITDWLNPGIVHVAVRQQTVLTPPQIIERLRVEVPHERVAVLIASIQPGASVRINFAPPPGVRRGEMRYADPYTGALLPPLAGNEFFEFVEHFHRWLLLPIDNGKIVAGSLSMCLLILALSGLYMRWPRRALNWRAWFRLDFGLSGRSFLWNLHSVIGTWALVMYVIFTTTGMFWAFDWFRAGVNTLAGQEAPVRAPQAKRDKPKGMGMDKAGKDEKEDKGNKGDKGEKAEAVPLDLTLAWTTFLREAGPYTLVNIRISDKSAQPVQFNYLLPDASHERARNRLNVLPLTGEIKLNERFADKNAGGLFIGAIYPLHMGTYFGLPGRIIMTIAALMMPLFGITGWMLYLDRRRKKRAVRAERALLDQSKTATANSGHADSKDAVLLAYATQAGQAERIALHTAAALQKAGVAVSVQSLAALDPERLRHFQRVLFVVSTFGEGEPPDSARRFARQLAHQAGSTLSHVQYGLLALGDRNYEKFCGFGQTLDHWLRSQGAQALFPLIEVDNNAATSLSKWQHELSVLTGGIALTEPQQATTPVAIAEPFYAPWTLRARTLLNPGSCGLGIYHLELEAPTARDLHWQSGALAELLPRHADDRIALFLKRAGVNGDAIVQYRERACTLTEALARSVLPAAGSLAPGISAQALSDSLQPLAARKYSVASIPDDGRVHLLVRQAMHEDGLGIASGWLTEYAPLGSSIELRLLENSSFALAPEPNPAIFIGNGSGLAGLRGHLRARVQMGLRRNWLLFGERQREHDFLYRTEIEQWMQDDMLGRVDLAFSRDQSERVYVQDKLRQAADTLQAWIADGAVLYVCGSLDGMAAGVDAALIEILGESALDDLIAQGRYRRDVY